MTVKRTQMREERPVVVIGGGGHAKVVIGTLLEAGYSVAGVYDDAPQLQGKKILEVPVRGNIASLRFERTRRGVLALGENRMRKDLAEMLEDFEWITVVHPRAWVHSSVQLGKGTVIFAGAMIQPEARIGNHCIINTGATVDHECVIEDFVHIGPGAHLAGRVRVGEGTFVGMGSSVIQCCTIGKWSLVGAGAAVIQDVPSGVVVAGVPARIKHELAVRRD